MLLARVKEPIVSTAKFDTLNGQKLLMVEIVTSKNHCLQGTGRHQVCLDAVGAGVGELVLVVQGSSALKAGPMKDSPTDGVIVGIIDSLQTAGKSLNHQLSD